MRLNIFPFSFLDFTQDIAKHFFVFRDDGEENGPNRSDWAACGACGFVCVSGV
jgi:hypothetical protein